MRRGLETRAEVEMTFYFFRVVIDFTLLSLNLRLIRVIIDIPSLASTAASVSKKSEKQKILPSAK